MRIDKAKIQTLIPHAGTMCLLETVIDWDQEHIACITETHRDPHNPLRYQGRLAALHGVEYGAQAAAIHGSLCAQTVGKTAPPGYLAALRDVHWTIAHLDSIAAPLDVTAHLLMGDAGHCIYTIRLSAAKQTLVEARITIAAQPPQGGDS